LECCNDNHFWHTATTADAVIPCSGTLADRPPFLLPLPLDGSGQPLFSPESTSSHMGRRCRSRRTARRRYLQVRTRDHQQSMEMAACPLLLPLVLPLLLPFSLSGARTRICPSRLPALTMAFFPLLTCPPVFLPLLPSGARTLSPRARVCLNRLLLHLFLARLTRPLNSFSACNSTVFVHSFTFSFSSMRRGYQAPSSTESVRAGAGALE